MKRRSIAPMVVCLTFLAACQQMPTAADRGPAPAGPDAQCPAMPQYKALYVGPYRGRDNAIAAADLVRDVRCAEAIKSARFPNGFVTVFGSSRISENNAACNAGESDCDPDLKTRHDALYRAVRQFAARWTARYGSRLPILSGAGPGIMEAANRGAADARGPSVGYTTYYDRAAAPTVELPYGGDPARALNAYVTDGLIFSSVAEREAAMIRHSSAIVFAQGGTGTEWEIFQVLEMAKSSQLRSVPIYFFGPRRTWASLEARLAFIFSEKTARRSELEFIRFAEMPDQLVAAIANDLGLQ